MVSPSLNLKVSFCISFGEDAAAFAAACDISDNLIRREGVKMDHQIVLTIRKWFVDASDSDDEDDDREGER